MIVSILEGVIVEPAMVSSAQLMFPMNSPTNKTNSRPYTMLKQVNFAGGQNCQTKQVELAINSSVQLSSFVFFSLSDSRCDD